MVLRATWRCAGRERQEELRIRTPLGDALAWLREEAGQGELVVHVDVVHDGRYIESRKHSAFGALAFCELPEISGTSARLRLTAVPQEWLDSANKVVAVLGRSGLPSHIEDRTLEIRSDALSPSSLLRRAGPALFALDSFSRQRASQVEFAAVRRAAAKVFKDEGFGACQKLPSSA